MIQEQLVRMFVTGLREEKVCHDVFATHPETLDAAITAASAVAHTHALSRAPGRCDRQEEAMEIGSLPPPPVALMW